MTTEAVRPATARQRWYSILYIQVLIAIALGILIGYYYPNIGKALKPLGDGFIALIKMMIAPVIFCTVVHGISSMGDLKRVGRVGLKTLVYFEAVSTLALAIGLIVGEILQPGHGFNIDPASIDPKAVTSYVTQAKETGIVTHLLAIIPDSYFDALARGDLSPASLSPISARSASRSPMRSTGPPKCSSASSASSCVSRRSVLSARWHSRSAPTASSRSGI